MTIKQLRLLIIDDDENYQYVLSRTLVRRGFVVKVAMNPEDALTTCNDFQPEFILLDLNLAGLSGLNLIQPLLELTPKARIVVLTGYASIQTTVNAIRLGAKHYLPKPADISEILKALLEDEIEVEFLPSENQLSISHIEWEYIQRKLAENNGNISATARALKMHRRTLQRKLNKHRLIKPNMPESSI